MSRITPVRRRTAATVLVLATALFLATLAAARLLPDALAEVALADLPKEAREVYELIGKGGPFHHERDGVVFGNREMLLPAQRRGYYHEYTVPTPGAKNRGARRMVCGGPATTPVACWYTGDHYRSFRRVRE